MSAPVRVFPQSMTHGRVVEIQERRRSSATGRYGGRRVTRGRGAVTNAAVAASLAEWGW